MALKLKLQNAAGKRKTLAQIEQAVDAVANETGEVLPEWLPFCERWVGTASQFGREYTAAMSTQAIVTAVYELPYDENTRRITTRMRIKIGERILNISSAFDFDELHEKIVLGCSEPKPREAVE